MDIFEHAEVSYPSRTCEQEEEEAAQATASSNLSPPLLLWNAELRQRLYPGGAVVPECMLLATSRASCALLAHAFPEKQVIGSCVLPEVSMRGNTTGGALRDAGCMLYAAGAQSGALLLAICTYDVRPERAAALARGLLSEVQAKNVIVLGAISSEQLRGGEGDPSQEPLVFMLSSGAARSAHAKPPAPLLPSGCVVPGLAAAALSHVHVRGGCAHALLSVDMVPGLAPLSLTLLASAAAACLPPGCLAQPGGGGLCSNVALATVRAELDAVTGGGAGGGAVFT
ncbi:hypothetical protein FOA52_012976 [Chlamydomonas sp. UWO 241]|nr:hypothetical protein FOA52_012976 [Chlamydomonas sp. UWO 241]